MIKTRYCWVPVVRFEDLYRVVTINFMQVPVPFIETHKNARLLVFAVFACNLACRPVTIAGVTVPAM